MGKSGRRGFLRNSFFGAAVLNMDGLAGNASASPGNPGYTLNDNNGRNPWIASFTQEGITGQDWKEAVQAAVRWAENAVPFNPDICCFPETFHIASLTGAQPSVKEAAEDGSGRVIALLQSFAKLHRCYVVSPVITVENGKYYNAAVLIDRQGKVMGEYRKTHTTVSEMERGVSPGPLDPPVFHTDFGIIGVQICYDIEWAEGWKKLADKGAEVIFWPSAFAGGKNVNMRAWNNQVAVVSSTWKGTTKICDPLGNDVITSGVWSRWGVCAPLNLEKVVLHSWPDFEKFANIQKKYGKKVICYSLHEEELSVIESLSPDIKVKDILQEFDLKPYREALGFSEKVQIRNRTSS
ncbi:MAG: carbon-nitrogen hydrolase family protein [Chitinophagaceae bacterium]|nr:carbon-nitrogen hydrolase family protein [Chitinophagaceae bacterium]